MLLRRHEVTTHEQVQGLRPGTLVMSVGTPDVYVVGWRSVGPWPSRAPLERVLLDVEDWEVVDGPLYDGALPLVVVGSASVKVAAVDEDDEHDDGAS